MRLPKTGTIEIAPSVLSADFSRLCDELKVIEEAHVRIVHLDIMDGHFVPNITFGPPVVAKLRSCSTLNFDAHLMITDPEKYAQPFVEAGVNHITFHAEVVEKPLELIEKLHKMDVTAGICINPETPVEAIKSVIKHVDMVLVMTVRPGFGGQKFMADAAKKIIEVRQLVGPGIRVEVDGGIDADTAKTVVNYGADTLVAGNAIFGQKDRLAAIEKIRRSIK